MARRQSTGSRNRSPDGRCGLTKTPATGPTKAKGQQEEDGAKGDGARGGVHAKGHLAEDGEARQQIAEMLSRVASQSLRKAGMSRAWGAPEGGHTGIAITCNPWKDFLVYACGERADLQRGE